MLDVGRDGQVWMCQEASGAGHSYSEDEQILSKQERDRTESQVVFRSGVTRENPSGTSWACPKRRSELKKFTDSDHQITSNYACNPAFDAWHNNPWW